MLEFAQYAGYAGSRLSGLGLLFGRRGRRCTSRVFGVLTWQGLRRAARNSFDFDSLFQLEKNCVCRFAHELEVIHDELLSATVTHVGDFGETFVAPSSLVDLFNLVESKRFAPARGDAG